MDNIPGNLYDKYHSRNPIEKWLVKGFFDTASCLFSIVKREISPGLILEAGCGEGVFAAFARSIFPDAIFEAFDLEREVVSKAIHLYGDLNIYFHKGTIYKIGQNDNSVPLVICSEVLEHLANPADALSELKRISSAYIFLSVPEEPVWRILNMCRFKYLSKFGNTPGHVNHYSKRGFLRLIRGTGDLEVVSYKRTLPWQVVLLRKNLKNH
jgi:2-polyprenyl-3-methyl-5-hydroxy-6-metoxy-1,4-benzoquinol methylase